MLSPCDGMVPPTPYMICQQSIHFYLQTAKAGPHSQPRLLPCGGNHRALAFHQFPCLRFTLHSCGSQLSKREVRPLLLLCPKPPTAPPPHSLPFPAPSFLSAADIPRTRYLRAVITLAAMSAPRGQDCGSDLSPAVCPRPGTVPGKNLGRATGSLDLHVTPCVISVRTLPGLLSHEPVLMGIELDALLSHSDHPEDPGGNFLSFLKNSLKNKQHKKQWTLWGRMPDPQLSKTPL